MVKIQSHNFLSQKSIHFKNVLEQTYFATIEMKHGMNMSKITSCDQL